MRRLANYGEDPRDERIRKLEQELWQANRTIVQLAPEPLPDLFDEYRKCTSQRDFSAWRKRTFEAVIEMAVCDPTMSLFQPRAYCPLCRGGSQGPYERGFTLPEGLRRHLEGYGNTACCPVTKAALSLAERGLQKVFEEEKQQAQAKLQERRQSERLFFTDPNKPPQLVDEGFYLSIDPPRDALGIETAEERLRSLGFVSEIIENVCSWKLKHGDWTVLADPRRPRSIDCVVYREAPPSKTRRRAPKTVYASFIVQDTWKHDIPGKFRQRLDEAIKSLDKRRA